MISDFYINVKYLMMKLLPKPKKKHDDLLDSDRAETLKELGIIMEGYRVC